MSHLSKNYKLQFYNRVICTAYIWMQKNLKIFFYLCIYLLISLNNCFIEINDWNHNTDNRIILQIDYFSFLRCVLDIYYDFPKKWT